METNQKRSSGALWRFGIGTALFAAGIVLGTNTAPVTARAAEPSLETTAVKGNVYFWAGLWGGVVARSVAVTQAARSGGYQPMAHQARAGTLTGALSIAVAPTQTLPGNALD